MTSHDASASALGYLYQTNWALLELLRGSRIRPDQAMTIELFDDVAWDQAGDVKELLQLKHHQKSSGELSDKSVDLWKTIKVWLDSPAFVDNAGPILTLITTTTAGVYTAASFLGPDRRDPGRALELLNLAAQESTSQVTQPAREAWLKLAHSSRLSITSRIHILGGAVRVEDVEGQVKEELAWALPIGQEDTFLGLVWQWWQRVALDLLRKQRRSVNVMDAKQQIQTFRDTFLPDNLPTLVELDDVDEESVVDIHDARDFVHQLRWVNVGTTHLRKAIVDYYRAVTQTTEWIDRSLIGLNELQVFENNLVDEWERAFADMVEDLAIEADDVVRQEVGKALFRKLRDSTTIAVRSRYTDSFFARGKRHELADRHQIGWHPDFEARIAALVGSRS